MTDNNEELVQKVAKAIADRIGNGMSEKYEAHAEAALEALRSQAGAVPDDGKMWAFVHDRLHEIHHDLSGSNNTEHYHALLDGSASKLCDEIVERFFSAAPPSPAADERVLAFGKGDKVVKTGRYGGVPAVFIAHAKWPGEIGADASRERQPNDALLPGEIVLTFPTDEQAAFVADALCNEVKA